jgi:glycosyltransferase involved in cell wall biosynthesis
MQNAGPKKRVLIFIVAYNAESTIQNVLERIPAEMAEYESHILIIDDSSDDRTFEQASEFQSAGFPLTVLVNPVNQGYGGNQKIGFHYAIEEKYDVVVLLHGDGQYAPERMPDLVKPVASGEADFVMGSRMLSRGGVLAGLFGGCPAEHSIRPQYERFPLRYRDHHPVAARRISHSGNPDSYLLRR